MKYGVAMLLKLGLEKCSVSSEIYPHPKSKITKFPKVLLLNNLVQKVHTWNFPFFLSTPFYHSPITLSGYKKSDA